MYVADHISLPTLSIRERNFKSSMATYEIERKSSLKLTDSQIKLSPNVRQLRVRRETLNLDLQID